MIRRFSFVVAPPGLARFRSTTRRRLAGNALGIGAAVLAAWLATRAAGIDFDVMAEGCLVATGGALAVLAGWLALGHPDLPDLPDLFVRRLLVIGAGPDDAAAARLVAALRMGDQRDFKVISVLPAGEAARLTAQRLRDRDVWAVVVTDAARQCLAPDLLARWRGCRIYGETEFWDSELRRVDIDHPAAVIALPLLPASGPPVLGQRARDAALSRGGDILLGLALLLFTLPLMLLTALAIRLDSPGPVFYRQQRIGLHGCRFTLFKFRSMVMNAEARGPVWAASHDPRVTRVGAVIRLTRIDELPQLANVLRGEMSLIGPRPERPHFVNQLAGAMPLYRERVRVKPGLTGWAQINYPYGASVEDARVKLSYDLYYVKHRSPKLAVLILFSTIWVVLFRKGAR